MAKREENKNALTEVELQDLTERVNDVLSYVDEYKKQNKPGNTNDMMALYKIVSEYEQKISSFKFKTTDKTKMTNTAQHADLLGRREDAKENKRIIAKAISKSMDDIKFDANEYTDKLTGLLSEKDRNKKEAKDLFSALSEYKKAMGDTSQKKHINRADAKQNLINACVEYVKHPGSNLDALNVVYDIAAVMGKQNVKAFNDMQPEDFSNLLVRKNIPYFDKAQGTPKTVHVSFTVADVPGVTQKALDEINAKNSEGNEKSPQEKDEAIKRYTNRLYATDRFAHVSEEERKQIKKDLVASGVEATDEELTDMANEKIGERISKDIPWNKVTLDATVGDKDKFAHRQEVMRQWFPDDTKLLFGATAEKNKARTFFTTLTNETYNGFFRSFKNSPEYTALLTALYKYTKELETDAVKDQTKLAAVKEACNKYLEHYDNKEEKRKSDFAKMRRDKVEELLEALGGNEKEVSKDTATKSRGNAKKTSVAELEEGSKKEVGKTSKQSATKTKSKDLGRGKN